MRKVSLAKAPDTGYDAGDAARQQVGHPDCDQHDRHDHQGGRQRQASRRALQTGPDLAHQTVALQRHDAVGFGGHCADTFGGCGGGAVEVLDIGADGDEPKAARRVAETPRVIGDGGCGRELL